MPGSCSSALISLAKEKRSLPNAVELAALFQNGHGQAATCVFACRKQQSKQTCRAIASRILHLPLRTSGDNLGIRAALEPVTLLLKYATQFAVVVYLTVAHGPNRSVFVRHWLSARGGQIDDAQPCMDQRSIRPHANTPRVGTSVMKSFRYAQGVFFTLRQNSEPSCNPAHLERRSCR